MTSPLHIDNRKARFEFELIEKFEAGIMLTGTEIKSVRAGKVNLSEAFCQFRADGLYVRNMHISEYTLGTHYNHEPKRERKLLLNKREMKKLHGKVKEKGLTIVVTRMFMSQTGYAKVEIALAKGKKLYDKRESIKDRDVERNMRREE
ncbi:MAG: SsrA-binding protein SmpB [Bacteroidota bacterium]|nr:SsrA-binding protein SmpB [Bacteroidota bacterium]